MHAPIRTWFLAASIVLAACSGGAKMQPDGGGGGMDGESVVCKGPVLEETPAVSIAGTWDFTPLAGTRTQIQVPGGGWFKQGFNIPSATYETNITVPDLGRPQTTLLELGAVNHEATLSVDGMVVGTNTTSFTPSVFDMTGLVTPGGTHAISLVVKGRKGLLNTVGRKNVPDAAGWSANAIRGSNSDQDFMTGHDNMVNHARALVMRDRNHPSVIRWSQSNEANFSTTDSLAFENDLYNAIVALDPTRPVSTDGGDVYNAMTYPNFSAFPHYLGGFGVDSSGDWPVSIPALTRDTDVTRNLVMFNDTFAGTGVDVTWEMRADAPDGAIASSASIHVDIPLGALASQAIQMHTPTSGATAYLVLRAQKNGQTLFEDTATQFTLN